MIRFWMDNNHLKVSGFIRSNDWFYTHAMEIIDQPTEYYSVDNCIRIMEIGDIVKVDMSLLARGYKYD